MGSFYTRDRVRVQGQQAPVSERQNWQDKKTLADRDIKALVRKKKSQVKGGQTGSLRSINMVRCREGNVGR